MTRTTNNSTATFLDDEDVVLNAVPTAEPSSFDTAKKPPKKVLPALAPAPRPVEGSQTPSPTSPPPSPTAARRGRKPGSSTVSRSAREAARKSNHSRIEKLRREKINDALASLRELVPHDAEAAPVDKNAPEKEFKLEILERTVIYLRKLKARVKELEDGNMQVGPKLVPVDGENTDELEEDELDLNNGPHHVEAEREHRRRPTSLEMDFEPRRPSLSRSPSGIRLPPISSLFDDKRPYEPISPPRSGRSQPWQPSAAPPSLHLPSAAYGSSSNPQSSASSTYSTSSSAASLSHQPRKAWTKDDENVATVLVQFSAERTSLSPEIRPVHPHSTTPSSILGMSLDEPLRPRKKSRVA